MSKQMLWLVLVFSVFSFAEKDFDEARAEFVNSPKNGAVVGTLQLLLGKIPSVAECKSYDGPNLLVEYAQGGSR